MAFGGIVSVLMRSPRYRSLPLAELEALVVPAILTGQYMVVEARSKSNGFVTPVAVALWANVSEAVDQRLETSIDKPIRLAPNEWNCGDIPWLIALAGDTRVFDSTLERIQHASLKGRRLKIPLPDKEGSKRCPGLTLTGHLGILA